MYLLVRNKIFVSIYSAIHKAASQVFSQLEGPQRPVSAGGSHSWLMGVSGIAPGKIMEWLGSMRLVAL